MDCLGNLYDKSEGDVLKMQFLLDGVRKIVVLVLLMELVIQMQPGKAYEPFIKMMVGIMVVYSIVSGISDVFAGVTSFQIKPMQEFVWNSNWDEGIKGTTRERDMEDNRSGEISPKVDEVQIEQIVIEDIKVKEIEKVGGIP